MRPANGLGTQTGLLCSVLEAKPFISQNISVFAPESFHRLEEASHVIVKIHISFPSYKMADHRCHSHL